MTHSYIITDEEYRVLMRTIEDNQTRLRKQRTIFEERESYRDLEHVNDKLYRLDHVMKTIKSQYWAYHPEEESA